MTEVAFRRAAVDEIETAAEILEDAVRWADARGMPSWDAGVFSDPGAWGRQRLVEAFEADGLYLATVDGEAVATFSLLPEDPLLWPDAPDDALYLHRFAVREGNSGSGVGSAALAWMEEEARRFGRRFIRLDTHRDNRGIRAYYERAGFEYRGDAAVRDIPLALFELDLARRE